MAEVEKEKVVVGLTLKLNPSEYKIILGSISTELYDLQQTIKDDSLSDDEYEIERLENRIEEIKKLKDDLENAIDKEWLM